MSPKLYVCVIIFMRCYVIIDNFNYTYMPRYELLQPNLPSLIHSNAFGKSVSRSHR